VTEPTIASAIDLLDERFALAPLPAANRPVFVLAGGWRSGSTLMQRLVASTGEIFMWGEPYDHAALVMRLAESLLPIGQRWPPKDAIVDGAAPGSGDWIAKAYPHPRHLLAAHRAFLDTLFAAPAAEAGFARWGMKEVRLSGEHACYLRRLLPDARFVFVHRNPYDAFLSYRLFHDLRPAMGWWWWRWPDVPVRTATEFGGMWRTLVDSFLDWSPRIEGVTAAYEDFSAGRGLEAVEALIGAPVDRRVLEVRVARKPGKRADHEGLQTVLSTEEIADLAAATAPTAQRLGYRGPSEPEVTA